MKYSFSTLGCPNWSWQEVLSSARDLGYDAVEIRGLGSDLFAPRMKIFSAERLDQTRSELKKSKLEISCFATECKLFDIREDVVAEVSNYLALAANLGCRYLRLLGGGGAPGPDGEINENLVIDRMQRLIPVAARSGVIMLIETNGVYAHSARLAALLEKLDSPYIGALWDINHPFRYCGESVEETWANIGKWVKYVHLKDSVQNPDGSISYRMLTKGDLPVREMVALLKKNGWDGFLSLEWTKRWNKELEDAGIVFAHYINIIKTL